MKTPARPALFPVTAPAFFVALGLACAVFSAQAQTIVAPLFDEPGDIAPVIAPVTKAELKARRQFDMLDANKDGLLSRKEIAALPMLSRAFDKADLNQDHMVSFDEIKEFFLQNRVALERLKR